MTCGLRQFDLIDSNQENKQNAIKLNEKQNNDKFYFDILTSNTADLQGYQAVLAFFGRKRLVNQCKLVGEGALMVMKEVDVTINDRSKFSYTKTIFTFNALE